MRGAIEFGRLPSITKKSFTSSKLTWKWHHIFHNTLGISPMSFVFTVEMGRISRVLWWKWYHITWNSTLQGTAPQISQYLLVQGWKLVYQYQQCYLLWLAAIFQELDLRLSGLPHHLVKAWIQWRYFPVDTVRPKPCWWCHTGSDIVKPVTSWWHWYLSKNSKLEAHRVFAPIPEHYLVLWHLRTWQHYLSVFMRPNSWGGGGELFNLPDSMGWKFYNSCNFIHQFLPSWLLCSNCIIEPPYSISCVNLSHSGLRYLISRQWVCYHKDAGET